MKANIKYTRFEIRIHISLNLDVKPNKLPLIHSGLRKIEIKYVNNHKKIETIHIAALIQVTAVVLALCKSEAAFLAAAISSFD